MLNTVFISPGRLSKLLLKCALLFPIALNAQFNTPDPIFQRINISEGLPSSHVNTITQDVFGFLWMITSHGPVRYDGYFFKPIEVNAEDDHRLENNPVRNIFPSTHGDVWLAFANGGICRFDPATERIVPFFAMNKELHGLANDQVALVHEDAKGSIWIATALGLFKYQGNDQFSPVVTSEQTGECLSMVSINAIYSDRDTNLWIGTSKGLYLYDAQSERYFRFGNEAHNHHSLCNNNVTSIIQTPDGSIWAGTSWGLNRLADYPVRDGQLQSHKFERYLFDEVPQAYSSRRTVHTLETDRQGNLWIGTGLGLSRLPAGKFHPSNLEHFFYQPQYLSHLGDNIISTITTDSRGDVWFFSRNKDLGLGVFAAGSNDHRFFWHEPGNPWSLSNNLVNYIFEDHSGNLWISCTRGGLNKLDLYSNNYRFIFPIPGAENSLNASDVYSIYHDQERNTLWVGTIRGLNRIDLSTGAIKVYEQKTGSIRHLAANIVGAIHPDPEGFIWMGYYDYKISKFWPEKETFEHFEYIPGSQGGFEGWSVRDIFLDSNKNVWFANWSDGVIRYNRNTGKFRWLKPENDHSGFPEMKRVNKVFEVETGKFLIGTIDQGLVFYDGSSGRMKNYGSASGGNGSLLSQTVNDIYMDGQHRIWLATAKGLFLAEMGEELTFRQFSDEETTLGDHILSLTGDTLGFLWMATARGLKRFDPGTGKYTEFSVKSNLLVNEYNARAVYRSGDGTLYFGGVNGIVAFHPSGISENPFAPKIEITSIRVRNQTIGVGEKLNGHIPLEQALTISNRLVINNQNNDFAIEFAALHFTSPADNRYAYRLEPYDREWRHTDAGNRWATYTNLPPGEYILRIIASNNDNIWNEQGKTIFITILHAWYQTALFRLFLVVVLILLMVLMIRLRTHHLRQREKELEKLVAERTEKIREMDQAKTRFFTNLSHEIRTPLTLILGPLDKLLMASTISSDAMADLNIVRRNGYRLLKMVNQLLDYRKVESGGILPNPVAQDLYLFLAELVSLFQPLARTKQINLEFQAGFKSKPALFDPDLLEKILYNLLSNAIKKTPEGGRIVLGIQIEESEDDKVKVSMVVTDTGEGIDKEDLPHIFENFYQGRSKDQLTPNSTGIGLAYSHELVKLMGGSIGVESTPGKGTTFTLLFRFSVPDGFDDQHIIVGETAMGYTQKNLLNELSAADTPVGESQHHPEDTPTVLVVDDDADMREFIVSSIFSRFNVLSAGNGSQGYDTALKEIPDIVISDLMMPVMDGYQLCDKLKEHPATSHIPVVLLTARSSDDSRHIGLLKGAEAYLPKPFNPDVLIAQIESLLRARKLMQEHYKKKGWMIPKDSIQVSYEDRFFDKLMNIINEKISEPDLDADLLSQELGISKAQLYRKLKALSGLSINLFIRDARLTKATLLLAEKKYRISEVAYMTGFSNLSYFTRCFTEKYGKSPTEYVNTL